MQSTMIAKTTETPSYLLYWNSESTLSIGKRAMIADKKIYMKIRRYNLKKILLKKLLPGSMIPTHLQHVFL